MRKLLVIALVALLNSGCGVYVAERMMDKMTQMMEKMAELEIKIAKERRSQISTIEGVVMRVETHEVEVESEAAKQMKEELKELKNVKIKINTKSKKKVYNVVFADGREKEFRVVPSKALDTGVNYIITYNGLDEIIEIRKIE